MDHASQRIELDSQGRILATDSNSSSRLARITANGSLDSTFGIDGVSSEFAQENGITLGPLSVLFDGSIIVGASYGDSEGLEHIALAKFLGDSLPDLDSDGIENSVDVAPTIFSNEFSDVAIGGGTAGTITERGDQTVTVGDAEDPADGLLIAAAASGGPDPAAIEVEGTTFYLDAGESITVTHGSVIVNVVTGVVDVIFAAEGGPEVATASLAAGTQLTFEPETATFIAAPSNDDPVEVVLIGENGEQATATVSAGDQIDFNPETFQVAAPPTNEAPVTIIAPTGEVITANPGTTVHAAVSAVTINITPESLNLDSNGVLTVLVYGAADFSASQIDVSSVRFAGAAATHSSLLDANGDGRIDLQLKFRRQDTALLQLYEELLIADHDADGVLDATRQVASVSVTGQTLDDHLFTGSDNLTLFLAGKHLRDLLKQLFG